MKYVLIAALTAASPALGECPVAADLASGVQVTETDGSVNLFTALGDGVVQNDGYSPGGYSFRNVLAQGTHLVELGDTQGEDYVPNSRRTVTYPMAQAEMPIPQTSTSLEFETTITTAGGEYPEQQIQKWGEASTLTIGECTYDMIPGKVTYTNTNYVVFEGLHYLPDLELSLLHSYQIQGEIASTYTASRIQVVE